jgi:hypothetical protein
MPNPYRNDTAGKDFHCEDNGSIILLRPPTDAASEWVDQHIPDDAQWFGGAVAVEPRYISDIVAGFTGDGLTFAVL